MQEIINYLKEKLEIKGELLTPLKIEFIYEWAGKGQPPIQCERFINVTYNIHKRAVIKHGSKPSTNAYKFVGLKINNNPHFMWWVDRVVLIEKLERLR